MNANRAKMNYLQIIWDQQVQILQMEYAKKNSKKKGEYT